MKKILGLTVLLGSVATLSACGTLPDCKQELDECNRGGAYTEERTVKATPRVAPAPVVVQETVIVVEEPAPEPAPAPVIVDVPVIQSAEPQFTQISK